MVFKDKFHQREKFLTPTACELISNPNVKNKGNFSAVPAELTTMAGRLLREGVRQEIRQYVDFDPTGLVIDY